MDTDDAVDLSIASGWMDQLSIRQSGTPHQLAKLLCPTHCRKRWLYAHLFIETQLWFEYLPWMPFLFFFLFLLFLCAYITCAYSSHKKNIGLSYVLMSVYCWSSFFEYKTLFFKQPHSPSIKLCRKVENLYRMRLFSASLSGLEQPNSQPHPLWWWRVSGRVRFTVGCYGDYSLYTCSETSSVRNIIDTLFALVDIAAVLLW